MEREIDITPEAPAEILEPRVPLLKRLAAFSDFVSGVLYAVIFIMFIVAIFFRYVLNFPITWAEALIRMTAVWMIFWTVSFGLDVKQHISFGVLYESLKPSGKRALALIASVTGAVIFAAAIPGTFDYINFESHERSGALGIPLSTVFAVFGLFVVVFPIRLLYRAYGLLTARWREFI